MPQHVFFLSCQLQVGLEYREIVSFRTSTELIFPLTHLFAVPTLYTTIVDAEGRVGNDQFFINANDAAKSFTSGACSQRRIEWKHVVIGLLEGHSVSFITHGKLISNVGGEEHQLAFTTSFVEGSFGWVYQSGDDILGIVNRQAVNQQENLVNLCFFQRFFVSQKVVYPHEIVLEPKTSVALLDFHFKLFLQRSAFNQVQWSQDGKLGSLRVLLRTVDDVVSWMLLYLFATDGRVGLANTGIKQTEIFVYFGWRANCASRIARNHFLFNGYGWWQSLDEVTFGFAHAPQELSCIGGKWFYIATLAFGI